MPISRSPNSYKLNEKIWIGTKMSPKHKVNYILSEASHQLLKQLWVLGWAIYSVQLKTLLQTSQATFPYQTLSKCVNSLEQFVAQQDRTGNIYSMRYCPTNSRLVRNGACKWTNTRQGSPVDRNPSKCNSTAWQNPPIGKIHTLRKITVTLDPMMQCRYSLPLWCPIPVGQSLFYDRYCHLSVFRFGSVRKGWGIGWINNNSVFSAAPGFSLVC